MKAAGKRYIVHPSRSDWFTVWNISDCHVGNAASAIKKLKADIEHIRTDPTAFWFGGGDMAEFIGLKDKRFDPDSIDPTISIADMGQLGVVLMTRVRDLFEPIKHKCLGLAKGNHERHYEVKTEQTGLHSWLCTELGVADLDYCALVDVVFMRQPGCTPHIIQGTQQGLTKSQFRFFLHHGAGYAQTPGGKLNKIIKAMNQFEADVYMMGHVHDQVGRRQPILGADPKCRKIIAREKLGVISGSYLRTYAQDVVTYGEQRLYAPAPLGASHVRICPATREMLGQV